MYVPGHMLPVGCTSSSCQQYMSPLYFICTANKSFPGGSVVKESTCQCRRHRIHGFVPWVKKISWRRKWQPTPVVSPGKSHGQRRLAGYSPWGPKESDMTEHTHTHIHVIHFYQCGKIYKMGKLPPCHPEERPIICAGGELCFFSLLSGLQAVSSGLLWLYFSKHYKHWLMRRADSFEKTLMLGKSKGGGEGDDRGRDGWMASSTWWTWVWVGSRSWWWTGRPDVLRFMGSQRVRHDWATELKNTEIFFSFSIRMELVFKKH